jgi:oligoribonuclease NrnB/cAMP/cGMP phosphodiesterase (DHH superfamily)
MLSKKKTSYIIMYHTPCSDGWCALAIAHMWFCENGTYLYSHSSIHNNPVYISVIAGRIEAAVIQAIEEYDSSTKVLAFDLAFTYTAAKMLLDYFPEAQIYDHHKSTLECRTQPLGESTEEFKRSIQMFNERLHYDSSISGAMLAWNYFYKNEPAPDLVKYVQDRDLWSWKLPYSREINTGITDAMNSIYPYESLEDLSYKDQKTREQIHWLNSWGRFMRNQPDNWLEAASVAGTTMTNLAKRKIKSLSRDGSGYYIGGLCVYVCNTNDYISEIGEHYYSMYDEIDMYDGTKIKKYYYDYVAIWRYDHNRNICMVSLRARQDGHIDVSKIAQQFVYRDAEGREVRGGGHKAAAGFEVNLQELFYWIGNNRIPRRKKIY